MTETTIDGVTVLDFRADDDIPTAGYFGHDREWSQIAGVTLHQSGGPPIYVDTWRRMRAHCAIKRDGRLLLLQDPRKIIWHAQGLSKSTIGIEIEGNFRGLIDDDRTRWRPGGGPHVLTDAQRDAAGILFFVIEQAFERGGGQWTRVHAHRQSSEDRTADPGQQIWEEIAIPWMTALSESGDTYSADCYGGADYCVGTGRPIPVEWDPTAAELYWWRLR